MCQVIDMKPANESDRGQYYEIHPLAGKPPPVNGTKKHAGPPGTALFGDDDANPLGRSELIFGTTPRARRTNYNEPQDLLVF